MNLKVAKSKFRSQRITARRRGILFLLSFNEWLKIWVESGHWEERGRKRGQYVMARFNDLGAYEIGNVKIITGTDNHKEVSTFKLALGAKRHWETRQRTGLKSPSSKTKVKISKSLKDYWAHRNSTIDSK